MDVTVLFVCSNDTHVRMFVRVIDVLRQRGVSSRVLSLDPLYGQGVRRAAEELGVGVIEPSVKSNVPAGGFYRRPVWRIWRDVLRARQPLEAVVSELSVHAVVVGNDTGLIEKLLLSVSVRHGIDRTVLVQDGRIGSSRAGPSGLLGRLTRTGKEALSVPLRRLGLPYLGTSEYGEGGCRLICAAGPRPSGLFRLRSHGAAEVVVTGQPRYDGLADHLPRRKRAGMRSVVVVTTPFASAGLGWELQARQIEMVRFLHATLGSSGIQMFVKTHPREEVRPYSAVIGSGSVRTDDAATLLAESDVAVIGMSTLIEEAGILGCPAVVPGRFLHGTRFNGLLPDPTVYPTAETLSSLAREVMALIESPERHEVAARQAQMIAEDIAFSPEEPAASKVADAILHL